MKKKEGRTFLLFTVLFLVLAIMAVALRPRPKEPMSRSAFVLNTFINITLYDSEDETILDEAVKLCQDYENQFSKTIESSEVYRINHRTTPTLKLSSETYDLLQTGLSYCELSDGAFDLTIEPLSTLWDFSSGKEVVPSEETIKVAAAKVGYKNLSLNPETKEVTFASEDTSIDLGAIAKGYIADRVSDLLKEKGVKHAIINLGGNVLCIGGLPNGKPFMVGLQKPFADRSEIYANLKITDKSVVASGVYERHFIKDGINYHHILDPATGYPYQNGLTSVTILSDRSVDGDALSTTAFSLGLEKGLALIESIEDTEAFFMTEDGKVHTTSGADAYIESIVSQP